MKRSSVLLLLMLAALTAQATLANAAPRETMVQEEEQQSLENPVADPYTPPPGDPDPFAGDEIPGAATSPLNPAED